MIKLIDLSWVATQLLILESIFDFEPSSARLCEIEIISVLAKPKKVRAGWHVRSSVDNVDSSSKFLKILTFVFLSFSHGITKCPNLISFTWFSTSSFLCKGALIFAFFLLVPSQSLKTSSFERILVFFYI